MTKLEFEIHFARIAKKWPSDKNHFDAQFTNSVWNLVKDLDVEWFEIIINRIHCDYVGFKPPVLSIFKTESNHEKDRLKTLALNKNITKRDHGLDNFLKKNGVKSLNEIINKKVGN